MKKLLSLFAISSITLTAAGSSVACTKKPEIHRYRYLASGTNWDAGKSFTVDFKSGTPDNLQLKDGDNLSITFFINSTGPVFYFDNSIKLGDAFVPDEATPTFTITFNKSSMVVTNNLNNTKEIDIAVL